VNLLKRLLDWIDWWHEEYAEFVLENPDMNVYIHGYGEAF